MAGAEIPEINWESIPLETKYGWMQVGPGTTGIDPAVMSLAQVATEFDKSSDNVNRAMPEGVQWQGTAATAAQATLRSRANDARRTGQAGQAGSGLVNNYSTSFDFTKKSIGAPVEQNWWSRFTDWLGATDDHAKVVAQNQALDDAANRALKAYENQARQTVTSFPDPTAQPPGATGGPGGHPATGPGAAGGTTPGAAGASAGAAPGGGAAPPGGPAPGGPGGPAGPGGPGGSAPGGGRPGPTGAPGGPHPPSPPVPPASAVPAPTNRDTTGPSAIPPANPDLGRPGNTAPPLAPGPLAFPSPGGSDRRSGSPPVAGAPHSPSSPLPPLPERSGALPRLPAPATGTPEGMPAGVGRAPGGFGGGVPPMMPGLGARGGNDRHHRNNVFIPSDEPFVVELNDEVVDPVLGVGNIE